MEANVGEFKKKNELQPQLHLTIQHNFVSSSFSKSSSFSSSLEFSHWENKKHNALDLREFILTPFRIEPGN